MQIAYTIDQPTEKLQEKGMFFIDRLSFKNEAQSQVKYFSLAYNNSIVMISHEHEQDVLTHIDHLGSIKWRCILAERYSSCLMPNDKQLLLFSPFGKNKYVYRLQHRRCQNIDETNDWKWFNQPSNSVYEYEWLQYFSETNSICQIRKNVTKISFVYCFIGSKLKVESEQSECLPSQMVKRLNSHSKVGWIKERNQNEVVFSFCWFKQKPQVSELTLSLYTSWYSLQKIALIWQSNQNSYIVKASLCLFEGESGKKYQREALYVLTNSSQDNCGQQLPLPEPIEDQSDIYPRERWSEDCFDSELDSELQNLEPEDYLYQSDPIEDQIQSVNPEVMAEENKEKHRHRGQLQQVLFKSDFKQIGLSKSVELQCFGVGEIIAIVLTEYNSSGVVILVHKFGDVLCVYSKPKGLVSYSAPQWNNSLLVERLHKPFSSTIDVKVIKCSLPPLGDIYLHALLSLDQDFDDDLLLDAVSLLIDIQE